MHLRVSCGARPAPLRAITDYALAIATESADGVTVSAWWPSSLVPLCIAAWVDDARDTRPKAVISRTEIPYRSEHDFILDDRLCCHGFLAKGSGCNSMEMTYEHR